MPCQIRITNRRLVINKIDNQDVRVPFDSVDEADMIIQSVVEDDEFAYFFDYVNAEYVVVSRTRNGCRGTKDAFTEKEDIKVWRLGASYRQDIVNGDDRPYAIEIQRN